MTHEIQVGDEQLPILFSMRAIHHFCTKHRVTVGQSFNMLGSDGEVMSMSYMQLADLLYFGLKEGHRVSGKEGKFPLKDSDEALDLFDRQPGLLKQVVELYSAALSQKWGVEKNDQALESQRSEKTKAKPKS